MTDIVAKNWGGLLTLGVDGRLYSDPNDAPDGGEDYAGYTPTIYADPAEAQGDESGSSEANAMLLEDALVIAEADDIIGVLPGVGSMPSTEDRFLPAWNPTNSGTSGHPIRIVAKYPWDDAENRTELQNSGAVLGCPVIGARTVDYIEWINIYVDEATGVTRPDTGPAVLSNTTGSKILYCRIIGDPDFTPGDNHVGIYFDECDNCQASYNTVSGFYSGPGFDSNGACFMLYGGANSTITHNDMSDSRVGIYEKGWPVTNHNYGAFSYNDIHSIAIGFIFAACDTDNDTVVEQNLMRDFDQDVRACFLFSTSGGAENSANVKFRRNTIVGGGGSINAITGDGNELIDNLFVMVAPTASDPYTDMGAYTDDNFEGISYNGFYGSSAPNPWTFDGSNFATVGAWEADIAVAEGNVALVNDPVPDRGSGNYTVAGQALTVSSVGGPIGADFSLVGPDA